MNRSADISALAAAMVKAQADMQNPKFDASNPHFKSKFASLASVRDAVVPVFAKHGISLTQELLTSESAILCTTILTHSSGQWKEYGPLAVPATRADAQGFGSAATYARRYSMMAVAGVVGDEDDDGNAAAKTKGVHRPAVNIPGQPTKVPGEGLTPQRESQIGDMAQEVLDALQAGQDRAAFEIYCEHVGKLDGADEKGFIWSFFSSEQRSRLKKLKQEADMATQA